MTEQHFTDVVRGEEFHNLNVDQVCELIDSDQLSVNSEEMVSFIKLPFKLKILDISNFNELIDALLAKFW